MKKIVCIILCIVVSISIVGCSGKVSVDREQIKKDVLLYLKDKYEDIDNFSETPTIEEDKNTEEDEKKIEEKYEEVKTEKYIVSFDATSLSKSIKGKCVMIYGEINEKWSPIVSYDVEPEKWEFKAKEVRPSTGILEDLGETQFEKFETGYIGRNENTEIKINSRQTNLEEGTDKIDATLTVKTDFSKYTIGIKLEYVFKQGKWFLNKTIVDDFSTWKIEYIDENTPKAPNPEVIYQQLTNKSYFLTYCINDSYVTDHEIKKIKENADASSLTFEYQLKVHYENIGIFTYDISIPYEWQDQWIAKDTVVSITDIDITEIKNCDWNTNPEKYNLDIKDLSSSIENTYSGQDTLKVVLSKIKDSQVKPQELEFRIVPTKSDDNWKMIVLVNGEEKDTPCVISLKDKTIKYNTAVFIPKPKQGIDKSAEEATTAPAEEFTIEQETTTQSEGATKAN